MKPKYVYLLDSVQTNNKRHTTISTKYTLVWHSRNFLSKSIRADSIEYIDDKQSNPSIQGLVVPPVPPGGPGGDEDEDTYEEAEPYLPNTTTSNTGIYKHMNWNVDSFFCAHKETCFKNFVKHLHPCFR